MLGERYKECGAPINGGMSTVKQYLDEHLDRVVLFKTIENESEKKRLYDEINALASLRSDHVVQIYDVVIKDSKLVGFIEEYIDGPDLNSYSTENDLERVKLIWQIASGLKHIHQKGIIHRDIKPENIKISQDGIVKIFDFGLAKIDDYANTMGIKGTPLFAAPEQMAGGHVPLTKAVDVYAFAIVAGQVCGIDPYSHLANHGTLLNIFDFQTTITDPELKNLLSSAMSTDPEDRPSIDQIETRARKILLHNKHRAILTYKADTETFVRELSAQNPSVTLSLKEIGKISIAYNGHEFFVPSIEGEVKINNMATTNNMTLPTSCVISIGNANRDYKNRAHITFDSSRPEVIL